MVFSFFFFKCAINLIANISITCQKIKDASPHYNNYYYSIKLNKQTLFLKKRLTGKSIKISTSPQIYSKCIKNSLQLKQKPH